MPLRSPGEVAVEGDQPVPAGRGLTRRQVLRAGVSAGAILLARPWPVLAGTPLGGVAPRGGARTSALVPGRFLVHSDLHNHSLLSDGDGDPDGFYPTMRDAGFDVACLTDHAIMGKYHGEVTCFDGPCTDYVGINETRWQRLRALAEQHHVEGEFVTMPAFEWSSATVGHLNVWFTEEWIDALVTGSLISPRATRETRQVGPVPPEVAAIFNDLPDTASIQGFYDWLAAEPGSPITGGGADGLAGFAHPNEFGDCEGFVPREDVAPRVVSCEALNMERDFFHHPNEDGRSWYGLNACLNAGWRVGLLGVSDEHSEQYARSGVGRGGLWVRDISRAGVREALEARAVFATVEPGLRLAATAGGVFMGGTIGHRSGPLRVALDLDRGPDWVSKRLVVQVVRPGRDEPVLAAEVEAAVPASGGAAVTFDTAVDAADGARLFLRIVDPERPAPETLPSPWSDSGGAVAYTSPWWLDPDAAPGGGHGGGGGSGGAPAPQPQPSPSAAPAGSSSGGDLPATGGGLAVAGLAALGAAALRRRVRSEPPPSA